MSRYNNNKLINIIVTPFLQKLVITRFGTEKLRIAGLKMISERNERHVRYNEAYFKTNKNR